MMTPLGKLVAEQLRSTLQFLVDHEKHYPEEVDAIVRGLVSHLRSWKPSALQVPEEVSHAGR